MPISKKCNFFVRRFKVSDLNSIKRIIENLHPGWFTEEALMNIPRDIQFSRCFVAEENGRIAGFISVCSHDGKPMIGWLGVDLKFRGKGIGRALVLEALKGLRQRKGDEVYLEVRVSNTTAVKLYQNISFHIKSKLSSYYRDGEDAYLMAKDLS